MVQRLPRHKHGTLKPWTKPAGEKLNVKAVATTSADAVSAAMLIHWVRRRLMELFAIEPTNIPTGFR